MLAFESCMIANDWGELEVECSQALELLYRGTLIEVSYERNNNVMQVTGVYGITTRKA